MRTPPRQRTSVSCCSPRGPGKHRAIAAQPCNRPREHRAHFHVEQKPCLTCCLLVRSVRVRVRRRACVRACPGACFPASVFDTFVMHLAPWPLAWDLLPVAGGCGDEKQKHLPMQKLDEGKTTPMPSLLRAAAARPLVAVDQLGNVGVHQGGLVERRSGLPQNIIENQLHATCVSPRTPC